MAGRPVRPIERVDVTVDPAIDDDVLPGCRHRIAMRVTGSQRLVAVARDMPVVDRLASWPPQLLDVVVGAAVEDVGDASPDIAAGVSGRFDRSARL